MNDEVYRLIQSSDPATLDLVRLYVEGVTQVISDRFGLSRARIFTAGTQVELAKLSAARCEGGCRMGDAQLTIVRGVDGW